MSTPRELLTFPGLRAGRPRAARPRSSLRCGRIDDHAALDDAADRGVDAPDCAATACGSACGGRCSTPSSTAATTTCPPPTCGRACAASPAPAIARAAARSWARSRAATRRSSTGSPTRIRARGGEVLTVDPGAARSRRADRPRHRRRRSTTGFRAARHGRDDAAAPEPAAAARARARAARSAPDPQRYLGIVCVVARVRNSVSPYYALNITDRRVPLTSVVETTHVVDPEAVGGHLIYVPRYVQPGLARARASSSRDHRRSTSATCRRCSPTSVERGRDRQPRSPAPASPSRSIRSARTACRTCSRRPASPSPRRRRSIRTSSTARRSLGVAERVAEGLDARRPVSAPLGSGMTTQQEERSMNLPPPIGVTGAAGFIGANLVERLLDEGATVIGVDDFSMGTPAQPGGPSRPPELPVRASSTAATPRACARLRRLRRDRAPRRREDPALRRRAEDAARQRRRLARRARASAREIGAHVVLASTSDVYGNGDAAVRRGRPDRARPARRPAAGPTPRRSTTTSTSRCAWPRKRA